MSLGLAPFNMEAVQQVEAKLGLSLDDLIKQQAKKKKAEVRGRTFRLQIVAAEARLASPCPLYDSGAASVIDS